jgi:hypothetical protein
MKLYSTILIYSICFISAIKLNAQFNFKVGYNGQYALLNEVNSLFNIYNQQPSVTDKYKKFHFMNGLELGARYMFTPSFGVELSGSNTYSSNNETTFKSGTDIKTDEWRISQRVYSLGLESFVSNFGFGASVGYNKWIYAKDIVGASKKQNVFSDDFFMAKINVSINAFSESTSFALKPYYAFPITSTKSISPIGNLLTPGNSTASLFEKYQTFGLAIVFYNGRSSR